MFRTMLKSKIHRATVSESDINYNGSITIDRELMEAADIYENEKVQVVNVTNGSRLSTYAIAGDSGSGQIILNGAAARLMHRGDVVIILSYSIIEEDMAKNYKPTVVMVDDDNKLALVSKYSTADKASR